MKYLILMFVVLMGCSNPSGPTVPAVHVPPALSAPIKEKDSPKPYLLSDTIWVRTDDYRMEIPRMSGSLLSYKIYRDDIMISSGSAPYDDKRYYEDFMADSILYFDYLHEFDLQPISHFYAGIWHYESGGEFTNTMVGSLLNSVSTTFWTKTATRVLEFTGNTFEIKELSSPELLSPDDMLGTWAGSIKGTYKYTNIPEQLDVRYPNFSYQINYSINDDILTIKNSVNNLFDGNWKRYIE